MASPYSRLGLGLAEVWKGGDLRIDRRGLANIPSVGSPVTAGTGVVASASRTPIGPR